MFDINAIVTAAISAAVQQAVAPLVERVTALETICQTQHEGMVAMRDRITALENNPAQGVDTTLMQRIKALEDKAVTASLRNGLTRDEVEALIEQAADNHCDTYDHDSYDSAVSDWEDHTNDDSIHLAGGRDAIGDAINRALRNATIEISVS